FVHSNTCIRQEQTHSKRKISTGAKNFQLLLQLADGSLSAAGTATSKVLIDFLQPDSGDAGSPSSDTPLLRISGLNSVGNVDRYYPLTQLPDRPIVPALESAERLPAEFALP